MDIPFQKQVSQFFFSRSNQQAFMEDISALVEDGVPAAQAAQTMETILHGSEKMVCRSIAEAIAQGQQFADGLIGWFPQSIVEIIRAGEEGGTLAENMKSAARALAQQSNALAAFLSATIYPIAVLAMGIAVMIFMRHSIFVNFEQIAPIDKWPQNGRNIVYLADFFQRWWWAVILVAIGIGFLMAMLLRNFTGEMRRVIDKIPVIGLYRDITASRTMETMGLLLSNGISMKRSLQILRRNASPYLAWHLFVMDFRLSGGRENIADVLDTGLIKEGDVARLRVIAKGRGFEHALTRLGYLSGIQNFKNVSLTAKIVGGILLGCGALLAAYMIFAVYGTGAAVGTGT